MQFVVSVVSPEECQGIKGEGITRIRSAPRFLLPPVSHSRSCSRVIPWRLLDGLRIQVSPGNPCRELLALELREREDRSAGMCGCISTIIKEARCS